MILGVTGLIGAGKSEVGKCFEKSFGVRVIDCDDIVHHLYDTNLDVVNRIEDVVGGCRKEDNTFDYRRLGSLLYKTPKLVDKVNQIVHPEVKKILIRNSIEFKKLNKHLVVLVPLLFETGLQYLFDSTLYVYTDYEIRKERLLDKSKRGMPLVIMHFYDSFQIPVDEKVLLCDHVIFNNGDGSDLYDSVERLFLKVF